MRNAVLRAAVLALALGPWAARAFAAPAATDSVGGAFSMVDRMITNAETLVIRAENSLSGATTIPTDQASCLKQFSVNSMLATAAKDGNTLPDEMSGEKETLLLNTYWHQICVSLAAKSPDGCQALRALEKDGESLSMSRVKFCEDYVFELQMKRDLISGSPAAANSCQAAMSRGRTPVAPQDLGRFCSILRSRGSAEQICPQMAALIKDANALKKCPSFVNTILGREPCGQTQGFHEKAANVCPDVAAYAKSVQGGAACASPLCRVMAGAGAEACKPFSDTVARLYCGAFVRKVAPVLKGTRATEAQSGAQQDEKTFLELVDAAHEALMRLDAAAGPTQAPEIDSREETLADLQERWDKTRRRGNALKVAPGVPPTSAPPAKP